MVGKATAIGVIIIVALLGIGSFLFINSLTPLEKRNTILNDTFNIQANKYDNRTAWVSSSGEYVASFAVSGGTINFSWVPSVDAWLSGQFKPDWYETDHADYGFNPILGQEGIRSPFSFVFLNNDTVTKEVHLEVFKVWKETNYAGLLGGATLVLSSAIIAIVLRYRRET